MDQTIDDLEKRMLPWSLIPDGKGKTMISNIISDNITYGPEVKEEVKILLSSIVGLPRNAMYYKLIEGDKRYYLVLTKDSLTSKHEPLALDNNLDSLNKANQVVVVQIRRSVICDFLEKHCSNAIKIEQVWSFK
jgi:hypothetical protein